MANKQVKNKTVIVKHGDCCYTVHSKGIGTEETVKKRGFIIQNRDVVQTVPFKHSEYKRRKEHQVRETDNGKLCLTPSRQKVKLTISFDRIKDSEDAFMRQFLELIQGYELDVLKYETETCLE